MSNKCLDCVPANEEECNVCEEMKEIKNAAINSYKALYEQDIKELKQLLDKSISQSDRAANGWERAEIHIVELELINEQHRLLNGRLRVRIDALEGLLKKIQPFIDEINGDYAIDGD
jgi:hypothetical protein